MVAWPGQRPSDVAAPLDFPNAGVSVDLAVVGEPFTDKNDTFGGVRVGAEEQRALIFLK